MKAAVLVMWTPEGKPLVEVSETTEPMMELARKVRTSGVHNKQAIAAGEVWNSAHPLHVFRFHVAKKEPKAKSK